jgi:hypothetical protein
MMHHVGGELAPRSNHSSGLREDTLFTQSRLCVMYGVLALSTAVSSDHSLFS